MSNFLKPSHFEKILTKAHKLIYDSGKISMQILNIFKFKCNLTILLYDTCLFMPQISDIWSKAHLIYLTYKNCCLHNCTFLLIPRQIWKSSPKQKRFSCCAMWKFVSKLDLLKKCCLSFCYCFKLPMQAPFRCLGKIWTVSLMQIWANISNFRVYDVGDSRWNTGFLKFLFKDLISV